MKVCTIAVLLALLALLAGCERQLRNMYEQPKLMPGDRSTLFAQGPASRLPPAGVVPRAIGDAAAASSGRRGEDEARALAAAAAQERLPAVPGRALLLRGQDRYNAFCLPCHGATGAGDGTVVQRGFPRPPALQQERLRLADDRHLYDVIGDGAGVMFPFADRIAAPDRWAIVAYIRAMQLSEHAAVASLPPRLQQQLAALPPAAGSPRDAGPAWRPAPEPQR